MHGFDCEACLWIGREDFLNLAPQEIFRLTLLILEASGFENPPNQRIVQTNARTAGWRAAKSRRKGHVNDNVRCRLGTWSNTRSTKLIEAKLILFQPTASQMRQMSKCQSCYLYSTSSTPHFSGVSRHLGLPILQLKSCLVALIRRYRFIQPWFFSWLK